MKRARRKIKGRLAELTWATHLKPIPMKLENGAMVKPERSWGVMTPLLNSRVISGSKQLFAIEQTNQGQKMQLEEELPLPCLTATLVTLSTFKLTTRAWGIRARTPYLPLLIFYGGPSISSSPLLLAILAIRAFILANIPTEREQLNNKSYQWK